MAKSLRAKIRTLAYLKWERAGKPGGDGVNFWLEAESELVIKKDQAVDWSPRYIAVKGNTVIKSSNNLFDIMSQITHTHEIEHCDVVIWDTGTVDFPQMTVVASTCRGWLPVNVKGRQYISEDFGVSFTPMEMGLLKQLFDSWTLEGNQKISNAVKHMYDQTDLKKITPNPDVFKSFVSKLLKLTETKNAKQT